jgi:transposase
VSEARPDDALQDSHQERHQGGGYRRIELITGEARRRPWSAEEKGQDPGGKLPAWSEGCGGCAPPWDEPQSAGNWRHEARKRSADGERTFVPLRVVDAVAPVSSCEPVKGSPNASRGLASAMEDGSAGAVTGTIEIEIGAIQLRVSGVLMRPRCGRSLVISGASHDHRPAGANLSRSAPTVPSKGNPRNADPMLPAHGARRNRTGGGISIRGSCLAGCIKPRKRARRQRCVNLPRRVLRCQRLC